MKKTFLLFFIYCLFSNILYGQTQTPNVGIIQPVPTASSLAAYNNNPVSIQTGIPNISYPLLSIPTESKEVTINMELNYHAGNTSYDQWVGNTGKGWSILGPGVISREIVGDFDEKVWEDGTPENKKHEFDDIYNFNIPGESGKFRIKKGTLPNSFEIIKLTPYTSRIVFNRSSNQATLIINSFTITTDRGISYHFYNYDISTMAVLTGFSTEYGYKISNGTYRSAFYLTSITGENNQELVKYNYLKETKYVLGTNNQIPESDRHRLTNIEIKDRGLVDINYSRNESQDKKNDIFSIDNIVLKTPGHQFVKKFTFEYSYPLMLRILDAFNEIDVNGKTIERYQFDYKDVFSKSLETGNISANVLNKIHLPTGGTIEYIFDFLPYYYTSTEKITPTPGVHYGEATFNQVNYDGKKYFFTLDKGKEITIDVTQIEALSGHSWGVNFFKKIGNNFQFAPEYSLGVIIDVTDPGYNLLQKRVFDPGEYYVELFCDCNFSPLPSPQISISAYDMTGPPIIEQIIKASETGVPRIKNIKYFDLPSSGINNSSSPSKIEEYEYNKFDNPAESSEYYVEGGALNDGMTAAAPSMLYKNVKVSQGNNMGYTKYYFKAPDEYSPYNIPGYYQNFWPNYNIMRNGLIMKKEMYNSASQKLSEDIFDYSIEEFDSPYYNLPGGSFLVKTSWIKNSKVTSRNYFDAGMVETKNEVFQNAHNNKPNLERVTSFDGSIQETTYQYALEKNNQKLLDANMVGFPLEITSVMKKNSSDPAKLLSRSETRYENTGNKYPSSAVSYDSQNLMASEMTFNRYDVKGNLEQYTTKDGIPVSIVWGYNKTQPIAKVEGATYDQITPYVSDMISRSNATVVSEPDLQTALDTFRANTNLMNYQITTYLFDSLMRMKTMTPPTGVRAVYQYDSAGRLEKIEDETGKILKKYQYNYRH